MHDDAKHAERAALEQRLKELREPTRVVTVRMPKSLHDGLKGEAHERKTSLNQLCIRKLYAELPAETPTPSSAQANTEPGDASE